MYKDFTVPIPELRGKIIRSKKRNATYILFQTGQEYKRDKHYSIPHRVYIGKVDDSNKNLMFPNEKYFVFFQDDNNLDELSPPSQQEMAMIKDDIDNSNYTTEVEKKKYYNELMELIKNKKAPDCKAIFKKRLNELKGDKSAEEFAELIGVSPKTIRNYIAGASMPNAEILLYISDLLQCSVDYLLGKSDTKDLVYHVDIADKVMSRKALDTLSAISFKPRHTYFEGIKVLDTESNIINLLLSNNKSIELFDRMEEYLEATMLITPLIDEWQNLLISIDKISSDFTTNDSEYQNKKEVLDYLEKLKEHLLTDSSLTNWIISQYDFPNHNPSEFESYAENILCRKQTTLSYVFTVLGKEISSCKYREIRDMVNSEFIDIINHTTLYNTVDTCLDSQDVSEILNKLKSSLNSGKK